MEGGRKTERAGDDIKPLLGVEEEQEEEQKEEQEAYY